MRGDRTFAYDLVMRHGAVSGRVVLLLRSTEAKPFSLLSVRIHSPILVSASAGPLRGSIKVKSSKNLLLSSIAAYCYCKPGSLRVIETNKHKSPLLKFKMISPSLLD